MTTIRNFILAIIAVLPSIGLAAEWTISQPLARTQYDGSTNNLYFVGPAGWGSPSCQIATYVVILPTVSGNKQLLSIGLAAHMADKSVMFLGTCDSNPLFFNATYVVVQ